MLDKRDELERIRMTCAEIKAVRYWQKLELALRNGCPQSIEFVMPYVEDNEDFSLENKESKGR